MQVKEVRIPDATDRLVICYNPDAAERDAAIRAELISKLGELIAGTDKLTAIKRAELRGKISTMPGLNRFLRVTPGGLLRTDKTKAKAEENLDGKYLLAAKAGLQGFTKTLAIELGPFGITANAVAPGFIATDMTAATAARVKMRFEDFQASVAAQIPVRRIGQVADVAHAISFLASEDAGYVSGQVIYVTGGPLC